MPDEDKAEVLALLDRIRKTVERETADPHHTYNESDPVVLLVKAEDVIESLAMRVGILSAPRTVAMGTTPYDSAEYLAADEARAEYAAAAAETGDPDVIARAAATIARAEAKHAPPPPAPAAQAEAVTGALERLWDEITAHDRKLDDPNGDGSGDEAVSPTGDDYNEVVSMVYHVLAPMLGRPHPWHRGDA